MCCVHASGVMKVHTKDAGLYTKAIMRIDHETHRKEGENTRKIRTVNSAFHFELSWLISKVCDKLFLV